MSNKLKRGTYSLTEYERNLFVKYFSLEEIMLGTSFRKELKQEYSMMVGNMLAMADDAGDGFDIYWDESLSELLINKLVCNKSVILNDEFFHEMKELKVDFNKPDKKGYNFFISYLTRQDSFMLDLNKLQSLEIDFNYFNKTEKRSLADYFFNSFPTTFMMGENASPSHHVAKKKLEVFSHIFKVWSKNLELEHDVDKSIEDYYKSKGMFEAYINKRIDGEKAKTKEEIMKDLEDKGLTNILSPSQINDLIDTLNKLEKNTLMAKVAALKEDASGIENYFSLRKKLNQKDLTGQEPVKKKKI